MTRAALLLIAALVTGCGSGGRVQPYSPASQPTVPKIGAALPAGGTAWSNASLAAVFTELTHGLEWGPSRPNLVRYEAPVRVDMAGPGSAGYTRFLDLYLGEIRTRSGIDITRSTDQTNLHIRFVDGDRFEGLFPGISCIVTPGALDWDTFRRAPDRYGGTGLETGTRQSQTTIFIPQTAAPYLVRSCLIEEVAQALGPANDLYGLGPSIFNDDAAHIWPTALDYLMLKTLYQPEMRTGMNRRATEATARQILDRINPAGQNAPPIRFSQPRALRAWRKSHQKIFAAAPGSPAARENAQQARSLALRHAPNSPYHCHSLRTLGRVLARSAPADALAVLRDARKVCAAVHGPGDIRIALIGLERAIALSRQGSPSLVIEELALHEAALAAYSHEERLAALYNLRTNAYLALEQGADSFEARQLARAWAAYAYGQDNDLLAGLTTDGDDG